MLDSRPNPNTPWAMNRELDFLNVPRGTHGETTNYQFVFGLRGELPVRDWTWDAYVSHGTSRSNNNLLGVSSWARYRAVVGSPNYGRGATIQGNSGNPGNGNNAATVTCTSGLPIFSSFEISADCGNAISASLNNITKMDQTMFEAVAQGGLFALPAGDLRYALGTAYRRNDYEFAPDLPSARVRSSMARSVSIRSAVSQRKTTCAKRMPSYSCPCYAPARSSNI